MSARASASSVRSVGGATLASRVLGLVRDKATVTVFGGASCDALLLAWTVPNLFRRLLGEGALAAALVPALAEAQKKGGAERRDRVASAVVGALLAVTVPLALGVMALLLLLPSSVTSAPFESAVVAEQTVRLTVWMLPYLVLVCVGAQLQAIANWMGRFFVPALSPALVNVLWITGVALAAALASGAPRAEWVAAAVLLAGFLQVTVQAIELWRVGARWRSAPWFGDEVRAVVRRAAPMFVGLAASQLNLVVDRVLAEAMVEGDGAVSQLYLGNRLMQLPLGLIGISLATAAYPSIARAVAGGQPGAARDAVTHAMKLALALCAPAAVGLMLLAGPILTTLFEGGEFGADSAREASRCLIVLAPIVLMQSFVLLLARVEYANDQARAVMWVSLVAVAVNIVLDFVLVGPLGAVGLALATTLATAVNAIVLFGRAPWGAKWLRELGSSALCVGVCCALMGAVVLGVELVLGRIALPDWWELPGVLPGRVPLHASVLTLTGIAAGIASYFAALRWVDRAQLDEILAVVRGRRRRREAEAGE